MPSKFWRPKYREDGVEVWQKVGLADTEFVIIDTTRSAPDGKAFGKKYFNQQDAQRDFKNIKGTLNQISWS